MHISRVNLNLFVVFEAIFAEGSISAAARKLNLSQSAVSHALGRLRDVCEDPLFERNGQIMVPTGLARSLAPQVRSALRTLERALRDSTSFDPARTERRFAIGIRDAAETIILPPLMQAICAGAPQVSLVAVRIDPARLEADLAAGRIDVALDISLPLSAAVRRQVFSADPMVVLARKDHPGIGARLDLERYVALEHVQVSSRAHGVGLEDLALRKQGLERRVRLRAKNYLAACSVVASTDLIATLPRSYAVEANRQFGNRVHTVPFAAPALELFMYWHSSAENDSAVRWLRDNMMRVVPGGAS